MSIWRRILLAIFILFLLLVAAAIYLLFFHDWRDYASAAASAAIGRKVEIAGDLTKKLGRHTHITINGLSIENAKDFGDTPMFAADKIDLTIDTLKLLKGDLVMDELILDKPTILLEKNKKGLGNWVFGDPTPDERGEMPSIGRLLINSGTLTYRDPAQGTDVTLKTTDVKGSAKEADTINLKGNGNFNRKPFTLSVQGASVMTLRDTETPYPISADMKVGATQANIKGTVQDPFALEGFNLMMRLKGNSMAELFPVTGIALPPTPPYDVRGRLTYDKAKNSWDFQHFTGRMGKSDLSGTASWQTERERPKLTAKFTSKRLDFADLGGFIGLKKEDLKETPYVIPDAPLDISRVMAMDADVEFTGKQVISPSLPLDDFYLKAVLNKGVLDLKPVKFGTADGDISATMKIDANKKPVLITSDFSFRRLSLARLFEKQSIGDPNTNQGLIGGVAKLTGTGKSLREMLGTSNGTIGIGMEGGQLSNLLIELMGLDVAESFGFFLRGDKPVQVRCVIGDFTVEDGLMKTNTLVVDTNDTNVQGKGTINLKNEWMNIVLRPQPKDVSPLSLRAPIHVNGTLKKPEVSIDKLALVERGGIAAVLSVTLTPIAGLLGFVELGLGKDSNCAALLSEMKADTGMKGKSNQVPVN